MPQPKNDLLRLQRMAKGSAGTVYEGRATTLTMPLLNLPLAEAEAYILVTVQMLKYSDFVECVLQRGSWFDVYALYRDRYGWFVKIGEDEDGIVVLSHHPPEKGALRTQGGSVVDVFNPAVTTSLSEEEL